MSETNGAKRSSRTLLLVLLQLVSLWGLAYLTRSSELVYAYGFTSCGALGVWVGGKYGASYAAVLQARAEKGGA